MDICKYRSAWANFYKILNVIKFNNPEFLLKLQVCYVRPSLEFALQIFNTDIAVNVNMFEAVQRRVTKSIVRWCFKNFTVILDYEESNISSTRFSCTRY